MPPTPPKPTSVPLPSDLCGPSLPKLSGSASPTPRAHQGSPVLILPLILALATRSLFPLRRLLPTTPSSTRPPLVNIEDRQSPPTKNLCSPQPSTSISTYSCLFRTQYRLVDVSTSTPLPLSTNASLGPNPDIQLSPPGVSKHLEGQPPVPVRPSRPTDNRRRYRLPRPVKNPLSTARNYHHHHPAVRTPTLAARTPPPNRSISRPVRLQRVKPSSFVARVRYPSAYLRHSLRGRRRNLDSGDSVVVVCLRRGPSRPNY